MARRTRVHPVRLVITILLVGGAGSSGAWARAETEPPHERPAHGSDAIPADTPRRCRSLAHAERVGRDQLYDVSSHRPTPNVAGGEPPPLGVRDTGVCIPPVGGPNHTCNGTQEGEWEVDPTSCGQPSGGDNYNGGCNSPLEVFGSISCGETICGTYAFAGGECLRDTDWFEITLTSNTYLHVRGTAEHDFIVGIIQTIGATGLCADMPDTGFWVDVGVFDGCTEGFVIDGCVGPGKWWIFAAMDVTVGVMPCSDYVLTLTCEPCSVACCIGNDLCVETSATHCTNPIEWGDLGGSIADAPDCATADCAWACPGTTLLCDSTQDIDNSVNSDTANPAMSCATGDSIGVLWYNFVATDETVGISTCNSTQADDSVFALYGGDCTNTLVELACSEDEDCGPGDWLGEICYAGLNVGQTYYIQFAAWTAGSQGIYTLDIDCPCPAIAPGACCLPNGSCIPDKTPSECESAPPGGLGGAHQGPGVPCDATTCEIGACCLPDGSCIETSQPRCINIFGGVEWLGGEPCDPNPCSSRACCTFFFGNYTCANTAQEGCTAPNQWWYEDQRCDADPCPQQICTALAARSYRDHGPAGRLPVDMGVTGGVDPRLGGIVELEIDLDSAIGFSGGVAVTCSTAWSGNASASAAGDTVTVTFDTPLPDEAYCTIALDCRAEVCIRGLEGDVDQNGTCATTDAGIIKPRFGQSADSSNAKYDVDCSGTIATTDFGVVKPRFGNSAPACP